MRPVLVAALLVTSVPALAQTQKSRAEQALTGVNTGGTFSQGKIDEVVTPYTTSNPIETGLDHHDFTDRINDIRSENTDQGRVLRATEDSAAVRLQVDIDAQGPLFDDANWAHENADDIAGHYFSDQNGQCTDINTPVSTIVDRFCESFPARDTHRCDLIRNIWVDRTDFYRCDKRAASYVKVCDKDISYSCRVNSSNLACLRGNISVSGGGATTSWSGNQLVITLPRAGNSGSSRNGRLTSRNVTISVADHSQITQAVVRRVRADGVIQLRLNGTTVGTWGGLPFPGYGSGSGCSRNDRDGLLTVHTYAAGHAQCERRFERDGYNHNPTVLGFLDKRSSPPSSVLHNFYRYEIIDHGNSDAAIRRYCRGGPPSGCVPFSNISRRPTVDTNVLRFLNLNQLGNVNPELGKRWSNSTLQVRVAHMNNRSNGGWARIHIEFEGSCCDAFDAQEDETCE